MECGFCANSLLFAANFIIFGLSLCRFAVVSPSFRWLHFLSIYLHAIFALPLVYLGGNNWENLVGGNKEGNGEVWGEEKRVNGEGGNRKENIEEAKKIKEKGGEGWEKEKEGKPLTQIFGEGISEERKEIHYQRRKFIHSLLFYHAIGYGVTHIKIKKVGPKSQIMATGINKSIYTWRLWNSN